MKMRWKQRKKLKLAALCTLLLIGVASITLPHGLASYHSEATSYDVADQVVNGGGPTHEQRAKAFTNGTVWLEVCSGAWAWADANGWVYWNFQPPYTLYNAKVSAQFITHGYVGTWFSSAHLYFRIDVLDSGKSTEDHEWFGNWWYGEIPRDETHTIDFGTMNSGTTYTIKVSIRIHCENSAYVDLESYGKKPIMAGQDYQGYGRVAKIFVDAS